MLSPRFSTISWVSWCIRINQNCAHGKRELHSEWNFTSTLIDIHSESDERWPTQVTFSTSRPHGFYFLVLNCLLVCSFKVKVKYMKRDPHIWYKERKDNRVNTAVLGLDFYRATEQPIGVKNLKKKIDISLSRDAPAIPKNGKVYSLKPEDDPAVVNMHHFEVPHSDTSFRIRIEPVKEIILTGYVGYMKRPNISSFDFNFTIPDFSSCQPPEDKNCTLAREFIACLNISDDEIIKYVENYTDPTSCPPPDVDESAAAPGEPTVEFPCPVPQCKYHNITYRNCSCTKIPSMLFKTDPSRSTDTKVCQHFVNFISCVNSSCEEAFSAGNRSYGRSNESLCKAEANFLSCFPSISGVESFRKCKKGLVKRFRRFYGRFGKCLHDPFSFFFPSTELKGAGTYYVAVVNRFVSPFEQGNKTQLASNSSIVEGKVDIEGGLERKRNQLLRRARTLDGCVSWEECRIGNTKCSDLLIVYRKMLVQQEKKRLEKEKREREKKKKEEARKKRKKKKEDRKKKEKNHNKKNKQNGDDGEDRRKRRSPFYRPNGEGNDGDKNDEPKFVNGQSSTNQRTRRAATSGASLTGKPRRVCVDVDEKPPPSKTVFNESHHIAYQFVVQLFKVWFWSEAWDAWNSSGCVVSGCFVGKNTNNCIEPWHGTCGIGLRSISCMIKSSTISSNLIGRPDYSLTRLINYYQSLIGQSAEPIKTLSWIQIA